MAWKNEKQLHKGNSIFRGGRHWAGRKRNNTPGGDRRSTNCRRNLEKEGRCEKREGKKHAILTRGSLKRRNLSKPRSRLQIQKRDTGTTKNKELARRKSDEGKRRCLSREGGVTKEVLGRGTRTEGKD